MQLTDDVALFTFPACLGKSRLSCALLFLDHGRNHVTVEVVLACLVVEVNELVALAAGLLGIGPLLRGVN